MNHLRYMIPINTMKQFFLSGIFIGFTTLSSMAAPVMADGNTTTVTNLAGLNALADLDQRRIANVHIDGSVWWSSDSEKKIILQDESAIIQLELDLICEMPAAGDRIILEGICTVLNTCDLIRLSPVPVVENADPHPMSEESGRIHLSKGYHPIRVDWFNWEGEYGLEVEYEGPGAERTKLPDSVLFHGRMNAEDGTTNYVSGLEYLCRGVQRLTLPVFNNMTAIKTGTARNFNLDVSPLDEYVGLEFFGFITIPRDGEYTFYLKSDDGSRLFVGRPSLAFQTIGHADVPSSRPDAPVKADGRKPEYQWMEVEGEVESFQHFRGALEVDLKTAWGTLTLKVAENSGYSYTLLMGNRVRVMGIGRSILDMDGKWILGEFYAQQWKDLEQTYISPRIWNEHPSVAISDLELDASIAEHAVVHVQGKIVLLEGEQRLVLEDGTGRIVVEDEAPGNLVNQSWDVLGRLGSDGSNQVLRCCTYRQLGKTETDSEHLPLLTTNEQISQLSLEEATKGYPVKVRGVVISLMEQYGVILQDSSRGIFVSCYGMEQSAWPRVGDFCEVEGVTTAFYFNPYFDATRLIMLGKGRFPDPAKPTWDQLINGSMHCNYVEIEGEIESIEGDTLTLLTHDGRINLRLNPSGPAMPDKALGATVRMRGCLLNDWDAESRRVVVGGISFDQHRIAIIHAAPADPFSIPLKRVENLFQFDPQGGALQRVRVSGVLVYQSEQISCLMDGELGLRFMTAETADAQVGDRVEVVGFPDLSGSSPFLRNAIVRRIDRSELPQPKKISSNELLSIESDAALVQVSGLLLGVNKRQDEMELEIQSGHRTFLAKLHDSSEMRDTLKPGSRLELTGVYVGLGGNRVLGRPIDSFELLLQSAQNIRILSQPSWWTFRRLLMAVGLLTAVLAASLVWINLLHRKVEVRTQELGEQIRKRERAERQQEIEKERARLAHDLHDDLGSGLTEVNLLSLLAASPDMPADEKAGYTREVNKLLSRMVLSLDEIVWAENPKNDTLASLAGYFSAHAQRLLEMASVNCGLDMEEDLPDLPLDPGFRRELFLAFKETITNIIKHAEAKKAWLRISVQHNDLVVIVTDDGCGMVLDTNIAGANGLDSIRDRMRALGGRCEIRSEPGKGTTVTLQAPIRRIET